LLATLIPIIIYFLCWYIYSENIPITDDFPAIFLTIFSYLNGDNLIYNLFKQHNEHLIVYDRLVTLFYFWAFKNINLKYLSLIGNLSLLPMLYIFWKTLKSKGIYKFAIIPIAFWLFNLANYENMIFAMASLQNNTIVLFVLYSFFWASKPKINLNSFIHISIGSLISIYTSGSGVFASIFIVFILIFKDNKNKYLYLTILLEVVFIITFFYIHQSSDIHILELLLNSKTNLIAFILTFFGNVFTFLPSPNYFNLIYLQAILPLIIGVFITLYFFYLTYKKYYIQNSFIFSTLAFFLFLACLTALTRIHMDFHYATSVRYRIMGIIVFCCIIISLFQVIHSKKTLKILSSGLIILALFYNFSNLKALNIMHSSISSSFENYINTNQNYLWSHNQEETKNLLKELTNAKIYEYNPNVLFYNKIGEYSQNKITTNNLVATIGSIIDRTNVLKISGYMFFQNSSSINQTKFILLESDKKKYYIKCYMEEREDVNEYFKTNDKGYSGFKCYIDKNKLEKGTYNLKLMILDNGNEYVNDVKITINN
jgi:hypothetical protein